MCTHTGMGTRRTLMHMGACVCTACAHMYVYMCMGTRVCTVHVCTWVHTHSYSLCSFLGSVSRCSPEPGDHVHLPGIPTVTRQNILASTSRSAACPSREVLRRWSCWEACLPCEGLSTGGECPPRYHAAAQEATAGPRARPPCVRGRSCELSPERTCLSPTARIPARRLPWSGGTR